MELIIIANNRNMKYIILTLSLLFSLSLSGQHMMLAGGEEAAAPANLLLDDYPGASAAYSLRELTTAWAGQAVVRVRRSSDNTEQDFTATEVSDGTLASFCGAGDGFVVTWYDQSGNSANATQSTLTEQAKIISGGTLITENTKAAIDFDGSNDNYDISLGASTLQNFCVISGSNKNGVVVGAASFITYQLNFDFSGSAMYMLNAENSDFWRKLSYTSSGQKLFFSDYNTMSVDENGVNLNGQVYGGDGIANAASMILLGRRSTGSSFNGLMQEVILYPTDQASNQTAIETNINNYYSIY